MARIDFSSIKRVEKNGNGSVHAIANATYHFFEINGEKYFQLNSSGKQTRKVKTVTQVTQFNKKTAEGLIELLSKEFDIKIENGSGSIPLRELDKNEAINLVNIKINAGLNNSNTIFSNVNKGKEVWWFEPSNDKFNDDIHLLLNDQGRKILYYFFIKNSSIKNPEILFRQRNDKSRTNASHIEIRVEDGNFTDILGEDFCFKKYLKDEIKY
jgi:hypothetical protein